MKVLIAEDDRFQRTLLQKILEKWDHEVTETVEVEVRVLQTM